jgi:hypothetical protein
MRSPPDLTVFDSFCSFERIYREPMKTKTALAVFAALVASLTAVGQQAATPQPTPAQASTAPATTAPCSKATPAPPHKPGYLEKKARALACAHDKSLCDLPKSPDEVLGGPTDPKPCPVSTAGSPSPAKAQPQTTPAPPAPPASATANSKPVYVCPPKATLISGFPYCLNPDHSVVDAIPLPAGLSPAPPASAAPAPAQH